MMSRSIWEQSVGSYNSCMTFYAYFQLAPTNEPSLVNALNVIGNPFKVCERLQELMSVLLEKAKRLKQNPPQDDGNIIVSTDESVDTMDLTLLRRVRRRRSV